jgi:hypothetical protein
MTDEEFWQVLRDMPEPKPVDYRIYYNEQGELLFYSMEDVPGTYLTIDAETFSRSATNVVVQDGQLFEIINTTTAKLEHSAQVHLVTPMMSAL